MTTTPIPQPILDYVAYLTTDNDLIDVEAAAERDAMIADATAAATDDTLMFEERLAATIRATDLANDTSLADEAARRRAKLEAGFIKASRSRQFRNLTADHWISLGIPAAIARQAVNDQTTATATGRITKQAVAEWVAQQAGQTFTRKDALKALGCSANTLKAGVALARENRLQITHDGGIYTVTANE